MRAVQNRRKGDTVVYGNNADGEYWITITTADITTNHLYHDPPMLEYPWEERLKDVIAMGAKFREAFQTFFRGGWIPHHGYGGWLPPIQDLAPPITTAAPAPDDRRRAIWAFMTVRPLRVP